MKLDAASIPKKRQRQPARPEIPQSALAHKIRQATNEITIQQRTNGRKERSSLGGAPPNSPRPRADKQALGAQVSGSRAP